MRDVLIALPSAVFVVLWLVAVLSWFAIVTYGFRAMLNAKPGVRLWSRMTLWNPANIFLRPNLLTEEGRAYRRRCFFAVLVFTISIGFGLITLAVTGNLDW